MSAGTKIPARALRALETSVLFTNLSNADDGWGPEGVGMRTKVRQCRIVERDGSILVDLTADEALAAAMIVEHAGAVDSGSRAFVRRHGEGVRQ